ncbi:glycine zipper 2TM domain-containing protein [uncultured Massilia sp.]|uniref:glycine zipper 2TM domain-containing protein n=1 Tax=uncultured Massilia sp. TaxID=169973 RepID=UPI0025F64DA9|nr:glycine zipper 2TM domain-containing protein [uncultured Massilia sp.]
MDTHQTPPARGRQHPLLIAAALAVILFCAVGTAAIMGWLPTSSGSSRDRLTDADRAALAANLQQPVQPAYAPPAPAAVPAPQYPAPAGAQAYAAPGAAYGGSAALGTTSAGDANPAPATPSQYAPVEPAAPSHPKAASAPVRTAAVESGERWCGTCGNVESVRTITQRAQGSGVGAAGGAILGGLLGNQVGGGHGRQLATVAGAVGGAVVGNQVEGNMKASTSYEIRVRLDDGTLRTFHQRSAPHWRTGDRVRIVKGALRAA